MSEQDGTPGDETPVDLTLSTEAFSVPGDGDAVEGPDMIGGNNTFSTTCWGTPCPTSSTTTC